MLSGGEQVHFVQHAEGRLNLVRLEGGIARTPLVVSFCLVFHNLVAFYWDCPLIYLFIFLRGVGKS